MDDNVPFKGSERMLFLPCRSQLFVHHSNKKQSLLYPLSTRAEARTKCNFFGSVSGAYLLYKNLKKIKLTFAFQLDHLDSRSIYIKMKLTLATLMAVMVAVAHTAPVPGDNTLVDAKLLNDSVQNVGHNLGGDLLKDIKSLLKGLTDTLNGVSKRDDNALIEANVLNDSVKNVGNDVLSGLVDELSGLLEQLTEALGGLLGHEDNALSGLVDELSGLLKQLTDALGGLLKRGVDTEVIENALDNVEVANEAAKDSNIGDLLKRDENLLGLSEGNHGHHDGNNLGVLKRDDNALVEAAVANGAIKNLINASKRGDDKETKDNVLIKLNILNNALKNLLNDVL